jgi:hypothetical protein
MNHMNITIRKVIKFIRYYLRYPIELINPKNSMICMTKDGVRMYCSFENLIEREIMLYGQFEKYCSQEIVRYISK